MSHHSRPDSWLEPRPYTDPSLRRQKHGRILPLDEPAATPAMRLVQICLGASLLLGGFGLLWLLAVVTP